MGVGQSRELLGKVEDDRVFVCTNREELLALLAKMQRRLSLKEEEENRDGVCTKEHNGEEEEEEKATVEDALGEEGEVAMDQQPEEEKQKTTLRADGENGDEDDALVPVEVIHVPNHYLGDQGLIHGHPAVLQSLAASTALRSLDVGYNALTACSVKALVDGSGTPPNLQVLNLAGNQIGSEGCNLLAAFLATNPPLRELSLFHNCLYDSDVEPILRALVKNTQLRFLNLDCNYLTGQFLRLLLELLQQNTTLAVVLFDGPYNPQTFERVREVTPEEIVPDADADVRANARALLRKKLLRADLAGRMPFPSALVLEVEALLAPRRVMYITEKEAEETQRTASELARAAAAARLCVDAACSVPSSVSQKPLEDGSDHEKDADDGTGEGDDGGDEKLSEIGQSEQAKFPRLGQLPRDGVEGTDGADDEGDVGRSYGVFSQFSAPSVTATYSTRGVVRFRDKLMDSVHSRPGYSRSSRRTTAAAGSTRASLLRTDAVGGRELSNGFDRLTLAPRSLVSGAATVWRKISGPPCRLRACWCDPRDAPAPYSNLLHYHCKHEPTGGGLGDIGLDGAPLKAGKRTSQPSLARRTSQGLQSDADKMKKAPYNGCRATSHRCESIGFYGNARPDKSSMFFFASPHPMRADVE